MLSLLLGFLSTSNANTLDCSDPANASICDVDGDGVVSHIFGGDDCDDSDASVQGQRYFEDVDGDGYGNAQDDGFVSCYNISGYALSNDDCDDNVEYIHPGAAPNDSMTECMSDADGDGFGDMDPGYLQCFDIEIYTPYQQGQELVTVTLDGVSESYSSSSSSSLSNTYICTEATSIDISTKDLDENTFVRVYDIFTGGQVGSTGASSTSAYAYEGPTAGTDCDDNDAEQFGTVIDGDCDGYPFWQDCNDEDELLSTDCSSELVETDCIDGLDED